MKFEGHFITNFLWHGIRYQIFQNCLKEMLSVIICKIINRWYRIEMSYIEYSSNLYRQQIQQAVVHSFVSSPPPFFLFSCMFLRAFDDAALTMFVSFFVRGETTSNILVIAVSFRKSGMNIWCAYEKKFCENKVHKLNEF